MYSGAGIHAACRLWGCYSRIVRNIGRIDGLTRALGGTFLLVGAVFSLPGVQAPTVSTLFLWCALLIGLIALVASFVGACAWFTGIGVTASAVTLFVVRFIPSPSIGMIASTVGVSVGAAALFTHIAGHCPVNFHVFGKKTHTRATRRVYGT